MAVPIVEAMRIGPAANVGDKTALAEAARILDPMLYSRVSTMSKGDQTFSGYHPTKSSPVWLALLLTDTKGPAAVCYLDNNPGTHLNEFKEVGFIWVAPRWRHHGYGASLYRYAQKISPSGICSSFDMGLAACATWSSLARTNKKIILVSGAKAIPVLGVDFSGPIPKVGGRLISETATLFRFVWLK